MSLHFPDDPTEMIVGAPGVYKWRGERTMHRTRETDICVLLLMLFPTVFFFFFRVIYIQGYVLLRISLLLFFFVFILFGCFLFCLNLLFILALLRLRCWMYIADGISRVFLVH